MAGLQAEEENAADAHVRRRQGIQEGVTSGREDVLIRSSRVGLNLAGVSRVRPFRILDISGRLIFRIALDGFEVVSLGLVEEAQDRTSVVKGKSVPGRVERGGRRILNTTNK